MPSTDPIDIALGAMRTSPSALDLGLPAWTNARWMLSTFSSNVITTGLAPGVEVQIAPANPTRWMIVFQCADGGAGIFQMRSELSPPGCITALGNGRFVALLPLFTYGLYVPLRWLGQCSTPANIFATEFFIP